MLKSGLDCVEGTNMAGKKEVVSSRMPKVPGVKLDKDFFADLWWVGRVEDRAPGDSRQRIALPGDVAVGAVRRAQVELLKLLAQRLVLAQADAERCP